MILVTVVPITVARTTPSSSSTTIESTSTPRDSVRLVQELAIQKQENEKLLEKFKNLETQKIKNDTLYMEEMQKYHRLGLKVQKLESELLMVDTLAQAKGSIWAYIS